MIWGAIPGQVAAITMAFNITDEEVPEAVVSESDEQAHICLYRCKGELRTIETKIYCVFMACSLLGNTLIYNSKNCYGFIAGKSIEPLWNYLQ